MKRRMVDTNLGTGLLGDRGSVLDARLLKVFYYFVRVLEKLIIWMLASRGRQEIK